MKTKRRYRPREPEPVESFACSTCEQVFPTLAAFDADPCRVTHVAADEIEESIIEAPAPRAPRASRAPRSRVFAAGALDLRKLGR